MNSIWYDDIPEIIDKHKAINSDISCDVAVIGGGLTGLTCAYYLCKKGLNTIVLEKDYLMSKTSGYTTAKITAQHGLIYKHLIDDFSIETAKKYLNVNLNAINKIKKIIDVEQINCDFEYQDSYIFTKSKTNIMDIKNELNALSSLNYEARLVDKISLPTNNVLCAIKFSNQAQFHPRKYAKGLCKSILNNNGFIFENSKVKEIKKTNDLYSINVNNYNVNSKYVILATRYPFINFPGFYFLKIYQSISYCATYELSKSNFQGMYINAETPSLSARLVKNNNQNILLLSGCDHKVGKASGVSDPYVTLNAFAHSIDNNAKLISTWVTEDAVSIDKLPYIGNFSRFMPNMYIATGFKKWGMTFSNIASNIIVDDILGKKNIYSNMFNSTRFHPIKNKDEMKNILKESVSSLILKKFSKPKNPICTHLGCELSWNPVTKTWDCPCHGSRYSVDGELLYGPSQHDLTNL